MRAGSLDTLQRRKLLMACLLMRRPKVLLLDEPASGLIHAELEELDQVLRKLAREMKISLLVVEHRLELLAAIADEVLVLDVDDVAAALAHRLHHLALVLVGQIQGDPFVGL